MPLNEYTRGKKIYGTTINIPKSASGWSIGSSRHKKVYSYFSQQRREIIQPLARITYPSDNFTINVFGIGGSTTITCTAITGLLITEATMQFAILGDGPEVWEDLSVMTPVNSNNTSWTADCDILDTYAPNISLRVKAVGPTTFYSESISGLVVVLVGE